ESVGDLERGRLGRRGVPSGPRPVERAGQAARREGTRHQEVGAAMSHALIRRMLAGTVAGLLILLLASSALAQTPPPQIPAPQTPPPAPTIPPLMPRPATTNTPENVPFPEDAKVAFINLQLVFSNSQVGKVGAKALQDLQDRRTAELQAKDKALQ